MIVSCSSVRVTFIWLDEKTEHANHYCCLQLSAYGVMNFEHD